MSETAAPALHLWHIEDGADHWYAAESPEESLALHRADSGSDEDATVTLVPDEEDFTLSYIYEVDENGVRDPRETRKAKDWCERKGFVASSEW